MPAPTAQGPAGAPDQPAGPRASPAGPDPGTEQRLLQAARAARARAYAPYSCFAVGAALIDEHGRVHGGANIENAAYPQGLCAEAAALAHLVMAGGREVRAVAVVGEAAEPVTPCGGCRQKLREFAGPHTPVLVADTRTLRARYTLGELLPASFGPAHLGSVHAGPPPGGQPGAADAGPALSALDTPQIAAAPQGGQDHAR